MTITSGITLNTPLAQIPAIGEKLAAGLATLGLTNIGKLVAHLPHRHESQEAEASIRDLVAGQIVSARGEVTAARYVPRGKKSRLEAVLMDGTGRLDLVWFHAPYLREKIRPGVRVRVQGPGKKFLGGLRMVNPRTEVLRDEKDEPGLREGRLRPVYPASERVTSAQIERAVGSVLPQALPLIEDHLDEAYRQQRGLPGLAEAYRMLHTPESEDEAAAGRRRLAYDELLLLQLGVHLKRAHLRRFLRAPALRYSDKVDAHIRARLPFSLTAAQDQVVKEIAADLAQATPTNRLIQGDVGAGKTVVAAYAMLMAVADRQQAALMAPTEILAEQHFVSLSEMLKGSGVRLSLLTGAAPKDQRREILSGVESGTVDMLVGTHALLTESVKFNALAVVVIDEQHRFGVHQRATLRTKGTLVDADANEAAAPSAGPRSQSRQRPKGSEPSVAKQIPPSPVSEALTSSPRKAGERVPPSDSASTRSTPAPASAPTTPHVLVMTATPIPRTLAITLFGDLDISVIRGLPPGRRPVKTRVVGVEKRGEVYAWLRGKLDKGDQAFIVAPAIEAAGEMDAESGGGPADVRSILKELEEGPLKGKRLAALHGRLKPATRDAIMARLRSGQIDAVVATSLVEVGIDIPNATVMVVENADRFGLAQLHQLRGRVGRGAKPSACVLIADPQTEDGQERLAVMAEVADGFALAERDLEIRGPGELFGTRQAGLAPFKVADLTRDLELLAMARRDAAEWIGRSPRLEAPEEALVRRRLMKAHGESLGLGDVG